MSTIRTNTPKGLKVIMSELEILFADEYLVAINKPAGLLVHRSRVDIHATHFAMQMLRDQLGQLVFPVHRIDRPTSGVLLFALSSEIAKVLAEQFQARTISKEYTAIVRGVPDSPCVWDEPLVEKHDRMTDSKANKNKEAQSAITEFETRVSWEVPFSAGKYSNSRYSLVLARPLTGRKHQLRRHFNHMAHPIVGDTTFGDRRHNRLFQENFSIRRLLLAATKLGLDHPVSGERISISSPLGLEFDNAINALNGHSKIETSKK